MAGRSQYSQNRNTGQKAGAPRPGGAVQKQTETKEAPAKPLPDPIEVETKENPATPIPVLPVETKDIDGSEGTFQSSPTLTETHSVPSSAALSDVTEVAAPADFYYDSFGRRVIRLGGALSVRGTIQHNTVVVEDEVLREVRLPGTAKVGFTMVYAKGTVLPIQQMRMLGIGIGA